MISSIEIKSNDIDDDNYSPVFQRSKKEFVLKLSDKTSEEIMAVFDCLVRLKDFGPTRRALLINIMVERMTTLPIENGLSTKSASPTWEDIFF